MDHKLKTISQIIRVNHAGEKGAIGIYAAQQRFCEDIDAKAHAQESLDEEKKHFEYFEQKIIERDMRPTVLDPVWKFGAFAIGFISSKLGKEAVMTATAAVEDVIVDHYQNQLVELKKYHSSEVELIEKIESFCLEEQKHKEHAIEMGATKGVLYHGIKAVSTIAINIAKIL